jgi:hypothetical protein
VRAHEKEEVHAVKRLKLMNARKVIALVAALSPPVACGKRSLPSNGRREDMKKLIGGAARGPGGLTGKREPSLVEIVRRATIFSMVFLVLAVLLAGGAQANALQTPLVTACPTGYERLSVASLEAAGPYLGPRLVDTAGNNNGYVCGHALPDQQRDAFCNRGLVNACRIALLGLPRYVWQDDDNPASNATSG